MSVQDLRVVHFSATDNVGGSGRAAYRIHAALRELGYHSRMLVGHKATSDPDVDTVWHGKLGRIRDRAADKVTRSLALQYLYLPSSHRVVRHPWVQRADLFQLYNLHGAYFAFPLLRRLSKIAPLVWRLSDMWPLTGHCSYSAGCERWKTGCGQCPDLSIYPPLRFDTTALHWRVKNYVYGQCDMTIVAPSSWSEQLAKQSPLLRRFQVKRIPNGIDTALFRPLDRHVARDVFDLPVEAKVVMFSAQFVDQDARKGRSYLVEALRQLTPRAETWLLVAGVVVGSIERDMNLPVKTLGHIDDDRLLALAYSAADVFVAPSVEENLSNSVLESMSCGVPPVVFDTGGMRDAVRHLETGYLAQNRNAEALAQGIDLMLNDLSLRRRCGLNSRRLIEEEFNKPIQAQRFSELYKETVERRRIARQPRSSS